ncbi:MAG: tetratricopeptide repeat protein [Chlorobia bacterium]|nr:tetratricopeptide repeat protein [Fimbriimonadaceae bacterium]
MRLILSSIVLFAATLANAIPGVLIIQEKMPADRFGDPNVAVANSLAEAMQNEGLYAPVVWSFTDPIFRAAISEGLVKSTENVPSLEQAQEVAKKLKLDTIIFVRAYQFGNAVMGRIQLYKNGKLVWKDPIKGTEVMDPSQKADPVVGTNKQGQPTKTYEKPKTIQTEDRSISVVGPEGLNLEDSGMSLVRTWVQLIKSGPLKGQSTQPRILTPPPLPGTQPANVEPIVPKVKPMVDNKQLLSDLDAMIRGGQSVQAILILRDAVDAEPQDVERRIALVKTLLLMSQPELAANEARRAALLIPEKVELRAMAARAWMQAGREDEAMADLNEAVARDPNSMETRLLLAEVNLSKLRPQQAIEHLDAVIKEKPSADAWYKHALCQTLLGKKDEAIADLAKAKEIGLTAGSQESAVRYGATLDVLDKSLMELGNELRNLFSRAQVRRTDPEVKEGHSKAKVLVAAWTGFLATMAGPNLHRSSHDRRVLALNLLTQSLNDMGTYLATNDEELFADARINMGQALKEFSSAQTSYRNEIGGTAKGVGT